MTFIQNNLKFRAFDNRRIVIIEGKAIFKNGVCRGKDIISICEDWNKVMGWNETYEIKFEDWNEIRARGKDQKYSGLIAESKNRVEFLLSAGRPEFLGKAKTVAGLAELIQKQLK